MEVFSKKIKRFAVGVAIVMVLFSSHSFAFAALPNDPGFSQSIQDLERQWYLQKIRAVDSWSRTTGSSSVIIAVLDTGVDATHEDLKNSNILPGYNFIEKRQIFKGENSDDNGHGTLVTGVIAATVNNQVGIAGMVWNASILPVKVLDSNGEGTAEDLARAIVWATEQGASIINLSLGGTGFSKDVGLSDAISYAFRRDVVLVAAAGNDLATNGKNMDLEPVYPICDDNGQNMVIGVAALDENDVKTSFSNYGKNCVDVSAPGKRILSTIGRDPLTRAVLSDRYAFASGTSLAAPLVSAEAALLRALYPWASNRQIRDRIISSAVPVDDKNLSQCNGSCKNLLGGGRIDVFSSQTSYIGPEIFSEGDLLEDSDLGSLYYISGGKKQEVIPYVRETRFAEIVPKPVRTSQLQSIPLGSLASPLDGSLIKSSESQTVFYMYQGLRLPVSYSVFNSRGFSFSNVKSLTEEEISSWLLGKFLPPKDGDLVKSPSNQTVYWVVGQVLHPVNFAFYSYTGLAVFPITIYSEAEIKSFPRGEAYLR